LTGKFNVVRRAAPADPQQEKPKTMESTIHSAMRRREFLKLATAAATAGIAKTAYGVPSARVGIVVDLNDPVVSSTPVTWAVGKLREALMAKGVGSEIASSVSQASWAEFLVVVAGPHSSMTPAFTAQGKPPQGPESIGMGPGNVTGAPSVMVSGSDVRGLVYGLLELAERVQFGRDPIAALRVSRTYEEQPANAVRSVARSFCSELEDKAWYYDKGSWRGYLDMLATCRFNRFNFFFGFGYDFPRGVTDDYFHFPYPYLVDVPGYNVRVVRLANEEGERNPSPFTTQEREKNFEMLRFIAAETAARGIQFQLGIWTHAYAWTDSPHAHHSIEGLTPETHASYCRDALAMILKACPEIEGLTLRVHGESGIPEKSYDFWKTLFEAVSGSGRKIEIDMHAKGVDQTMIDIAADTGMPVKLGAKYSAEHQSIGYNQADIRELEIPKPERMESGVFSVSNGDRRFTRYGYADFLQQRSRYQVLFRLWPGTQRHLLSGDPELAAAYGRTSHFCGAAGLELCEPLTFKGREGTGQAGGRCAYIDTALNPRSDWKKFEYYYRVWGRCLYNPDADPEAWRRYLRSDFGDAADSVETAVANSSRVLPLMTTAHLVSASNHAYWPEICANTPIVAGANPLPPYVDTPSPVRFGTVSPLDPQLFSTVAEHTMDVIAGRPNPKYSPVEVAHWLEDYTSASASALALARVRVRSRTSAEFRRMEEDVLIQIGIGRFFAAKLRSGVLFEIYLQTGDAQAGKLALTTYLSGHDIWASMARRAKLIYHADITYGRTPVLRGHWSDRLSAIDQDIVAMREALTHPPARNQSTDRTAWALRASIGAPHRPFVPCSHAPPTSYSPGKPLSLSLRDVPAQDQPSSVKLCYRHVDQAERWRSVEMESTGNEFSGAIPGDYTGSVYAFQYYFELHRREDSAWFYPAFNRSLSNQPYYAVSARNS
jgi:hypothetical protein